jgi:hypothetical protein
MKVETWLFGAGTFIFAPLGLIYGFFTHWKEPVGPVALMLTAGLSALVGFYLWWTGRKLDDRPEDDPMAPIEAAEGDYGFFSPHSWWPLITGMSAAVAALGAAIGWWLFLIGMLFVLLSAIGFVFEYYRGQYAH